MISLSDTEREEWLRERQRDRFHDECGVFGIQGHDEAANIVYLGLYALQHRGQESCGIVSSDGHEHRVQRAMGLVADAFDEELLKKLSGRHAIGLGDPQVLDAHRRPRAQPLPRGRI